jgi:hypothetical protein
MDSESIRAYVTSAQSVINESPQMGEATTKAAILRELEISIESPENK